ncbi:IS3 family transposase [Nonomuraea sp. NPDC048882]|uniref:IS3 family transposase n=1 Tax=Nonomuraea sp. NPDC048882 TaxID=3154347 RepID=UPI0033CC0E2B
MKFRLIHAEKDHHEVSLLARVLGVSRQGYYAWAARLRRGPSARARRDAELTQQIQRHHQASDEIYGAPRIHADLREIDGERVGRKRVARLMRAAGLAGVSRRKGCRTTITDHRAASASDLVKRRFTADEPNRVWTADITYVPTWQGFVYLAVVLDVFSRRIVGWAMADHMRTELVTDALAMAIHQRRPQAGVIHHSDKGSQGGFNWSSQHLDPRGGVLWRREEHVRRFRPVVRRFNHRDGRRSIGDRSGSVSGG